MEGADDEAQLVQNKNTPSLRRMNTTPLPARGESRAGASSSTSSFSARLSRVLQLNTSNFLATANAVHSSKCAQSAATGNSSSDQYYYYTSSSANSSLSSSSSAAAAAWGSNLRRRKPGDYLLMQAASSSASMSTRNRLARMPNYIAMVNTAGKVRLQKLPFSVCLSCRDDMPLEAGLPSPFFDTCKT
jgi:hypothetical protein